MSNSPNREMDKPPPVITRYELTPDQLQDVKEIMEGKRSNSKHVGPNHISKYNRIQGSYDGRMKIVRLKYFKGGLCQCGKLPDFRVEFHLTGATLVENYCSEHLPEY
jgi:hypothetical protein